MLQSLIRFSFSKFVPSKVTCWNCKSNEFINRFICGQCKYLKEPSIQLQDVNYFELFDLPININVETRYLEDKYRSLQLKFHPDRFVTMPPINISYSQEYSAFINEAYSVLKNIHERAEYILSLRGFQIKECSVLLDLEFMEEILELQSQVQRGENITQINQKNSREIEKMTKQIINDISNEHYEKAYEIILYLKYRQRLRDQILLHI
ncbi:unnamed protein product [Paramecium octaurelia]|uniref:J domain-containing protein n=1 Tax=Paramecium octaurelia TaxID=43137 RepID=A0A8S1SPH5_PAROT|nr:unnamed protein product [Paramecium octaurelia]